MNMKASDIARFLNKELRGKDIEIRGICSLNNQKENCLAFYRFDKPISTKKNVLLLAKPNVECDCDCYIEVESPRLEHTRIATKFFINPWNTIPYTDGDLWIHGFKNVTIYKNVQWGKDCYFKHGTVIGHSGFGYERDENNVPVFRPHIGKVVIGDNVTLGVNNTVPRGTFDDTIIGNNVKTDDHVHIAHNVKIGDNTLIAAGAKISGSVTIGKNCWLGTNCTIMDHVTIGDNSIVGIGANVIKDIPPNSKYAGFMAQPIDKLRKTV